MNQSVALITGAGSGIGRQLAFSLAEEGYAIAALDRASEGLASLEAELRSRGKTIATTLGDVTDWRGLQSAVQTLEAALGPIDLLIANAGIGVETSALDYQAENMAKVLNVNLLGVSNSIGAVLPGMLDRKRGHLVAMSSVASFLGIPKMLAYCTSKAAVNTLMEGIRVETLGRGIDVTIICPGWIQTPLLSQIHGRLEHMLTVEEAARQILFAIRRKKAFHAFPARMAWRLRLLKLLPRGLRDRLLNHWVKRYGTRKLVEKSASNAEP